MGAEQAGVYRLFEQAGDSDGAEQLYSEAAPAGDPAALSDLAYWREHAGDLDGAEQLYRQAAAGSGFARRRLADRREQAGDHDGASNIWRFGLTAEEQPASPY